MAGSEASTTTLEQMDSDDWVVDVLTDVRLAVERPGLESHLRCVWTGYRSSDCLCQSRIPPSVVDAAWSRELEHEDGPEDRFFHFTWRDEVWLAYGLKDGRVRGVYCPSHSAERDERSFVADTLAIAPDPELVLYA